MTFLRLEGLRKNFSGKTVVESFNIEAAAGEFISLLGPSGCGKTTVLRMVAGFETPDHGRIMLDGKDITGLRPGERKIGMVFQAYALFPNMTVSGNIAFGLTVARRPRAEIDARVEEMLALIKLPDFGQRYPHQLSGGQQQRVALARALAIRPKILLLDEPLSALDAKIRVSLREEIRSVQRSLGITTLFVTHDQEEALSISDRIAVMNEGRIEQIGSPFDIYNRPQSHFAASFVGTLNLIEADVLNGAAGTVRIGEQAVTTMHTGASLKTGAKVLLGLRPESIVLGDEPDYPNRLSGLVEGVSFQGSVVRIYARVGGTLLLLDTFNNPLRPPPESGTMVTLSFGCDLQIIARAP